MRAPLLRTALPAAALAAAVLSLTACDDDATDTPDRGAATEQAPAEEETPADAYAAYGGLYEADPADPGHSGEFLIGDSSRDGLAEVAFSADGTPEGDLCFGELGTDGHFAFPDGGCALEGGPGAWPDHEGDLTLDGDGVLTVTWASGTTTGYLANGTYGPGLSDEDAEEVTGIFAVLRQDYAWH
ncbi:hypothetical protein [Streptomyces sp. RFCAC02]|uniref:hypothetical protein n=1 Tax=Streptomyces sp. RFCAC02 TaxID=2499143 RepID=UPI00101EC8AA|nr:hypothetical protein [Streptomyces sp. RFCAC02]